MNSTWDWICWGLWLIVIGLPVILAGTLVLWFALARAPLITDAPPETTRTYRTIAMVVLAALIAAPIGFPALHDADAPLPVPAPSMPRYDCNGDSSTVLTWATPEPDPPFARNSNVGIVRVTLILAALAFALRRSARGAVPTGRLALRIALALGLVTGVLCGVRWLQGGTHEPGDFKAWGSLTPEAARGPRVEKLLRRRVGDRSKLAPLKEIGELEDCHYGGGARTLHQGLFAYVGNQQLLVYAYANGQCKRVKRCDIPIPGPRFESAPRFSNHTLVEDRSNGTVSAYAIGSSSTLRAATISDVGILLRPPIGPLLALAIVLPLGAVLLQLRRQTPRASLARLLAAWIVLEAASLAFLRFLPYFGGWSGLGYFLTLR